VRFASIAALPEEHDIWLVVILFVRGALLRGGALVSGEKN